MTMTWTVDRAPRIDPRFGSEKTPVQELAGYVARLHQRAALDLDLDLKQDLDQTSRGVSRCLQCGADWPCAGATHQYREVARYADSLWLAPAAEFLTRIARAGVHGGRRRERKPVTDD
jgi:hypothetical protein